VATYSGTIDLRVTGNAEQKAELIKKRIGEIKSIANTLKPVPNLFDKRGNDAIVKAKEDLKKLVEQYGKGTGTGNRFSNTIAGLNRQLSGFNRVLGNVNIGSDEFVQSLTASEKVSRRLARAEAERLRVLSRINTANTVGRATSVQETLDLGKVIPKSVAGLELYQRELQDTLRDVRIGSQDYQELARAIANVNRQLAVAQGQGPIQGPALPPGFNKKGQLPSSGRKGTRFRDIATGAGFPLLFGGGPLQALAGGIGGAFGGLGGSIAASAIASQLEAFARGATEAGVALTSTAGALEFVREKSLFSSEQNRELAAQLEEQGNVAELATLLTSELVEKIGNSGVAALSDLGNTTNETTALWNQLTTQLQILISGPLNGFLKLVNNAIGGINAVLKPTAKEDFIAIRNRILESGDAAAIAQVQDIEASVRGTTRKNLRGGRSEVRLKQFTEAGAAAGLEQLGAAGLLPKIPVTLQDKRDITSPTNKIKTSKIDRDRVPALNIEIALQERLLNLNKQIAQAKLDENKNAVAVLEVEKIAEITASKINKIKTEGLNKDEQTAKIRLAELNGFQQIEAVNNRMIAAKASRLKEAEQVVENLEFQLNLAEATSQAERDRLKIAKELKKLEKKDLSDAQLGQAESIMKQLAVAQQPLNAFIRKTTEELNNLQQVAVNVSQGIGNAIGNSLVSGLQSLVTGAASIKEVFANMLKSVADVLAKTAAQMIAQYIAIGIAKAFALGANSSGSSDVVQPNVIQSGETFNLGPQIQVGGAPSMFAAEGAYVTGPTNAVVGEGGEPEYVIPESKMRTAMSRYSRGSRGNSVIPESGAAETTGGGGGNGTAVAAPIDVRYTVERINSVDYVTADQFQTGMQQAAQQGAKQGEQQTLKRLQMSGSTRKRIGI